MYTYTGPSLYRRPAFTEGLFQGRRQGALGHGLWLPLGAEGALCDCSAPSKRECFTGKMQLEGTLRRPPTTKSPSAKSLQEFF